MGYNYLTKNIIDIKGMTIYSGGKGVSNGISYSNIIDGMNLNIDPKKSTQVVDYNHSSTSIYERLPRDSL